MPGSPIASGEAPEPTDMSTANAPRTGDAPTVTLADPTPLLRSLVARVRGLLPELMAFGGVGALAFLVDVGVFNALRASVFADQVITAKVFSVAIATVVAWLGHRYLTYRSRRGRPVVREVVLFALSNVGGLLIAAGCLGVSHYILGFQTALADNIAGNVIGLALGTLFRFLCYRFLVFAPGITTTPETLSTLSTVSPEGGTIP